MAERIFEQAILIREEHLDTFGHVNNARYLEIFGQARWGG
jgi:thioesterase III